MREIKFKAHYDGFMFGPEGVVIKDGKAYIVDDEREVMADSPPLQYTGFKDANEQDIYEGDIVQWEGKTSIVEEYTELGGAWYPFTDTEEGEPCIVTRTPSWFEVIGNIFENDYSDANRCQHNRLDLVAIMSGSD